MRRRRLGRKKLLICPFLEKALPEVINREKGSPGSLLAYWDPARLPPSRSNQKRDLATENKKNRKRKKRKTKTATAPEAKRKKNFAGWWKNFYLLVIKVEAWARQKQQRSSVGAIGCRMYRKDINKVEQFFHIIDFYAPPRVVWCGREAQKRALWCSSWCWLRRQREKRVRRG